LASYRDLSVLYKALQLPPIGTVLKLSGGVQIQHQPDTGNFMVLRRTLKDEHIAQAVAHMGGGLVDVLILDTSYDGNGGQIIDCIDQLANHLVLTDRARNKLAMELFGDYEEADALRGFQILANLVFSAARPSVSKRKRVRAEECVVCLTSDACVMLNCGHECVCEACCDEWLKIKPACPVCKAQVLYIYK
jgi:hypothetical protein